MSSCFWATFLFFGPCASFVLAAGEPARLEPYEFENSQGEKVDAEWGTFEVPLKHDETNGETITLTFVRFKSTNPEPGHPIVYLAGGPGGSGIGTAKGRRFPLFMALRQVADVIAFDQRGTGASNIIPPCTEDQFPIDRPLVLEEALAFEKRNAEKCRELWREKGVDLSPYNTWESAADLDDLRSALGAEKLNLWGISYGTHLAFAAMKRMGGRIDRGVLASSEGPDHTVKLPAWSDAYFHRVEQVLLADPEAREKYPDFISAMRRVLEKLEKEPVKVTLNMGEGKEPLTLTIGKEPIQLLTSFFLVKNPSNVKSLPAIYKELDEGRFERVATAFYQHLLSRPGTNSGMPQAMDAASGISPARMALFKIQAERALIGGMLNYPFPYLFDSAGVPDLGEGFRENVRTSIPTLFLNGTLDGRTFPEETWELMRGFENGMQIIVENAGHDLFMSSPEVGEAVVRFFKGEGVKKTLIHIPPPKFD